MCNESCDAVFGDHAHAQMGAEDKRIVVQQDLLHFHGERAARLCVKCLRKRSRQRFQLRAVIRPSLFDELSRQWYAKKYSGAPVGAVTMALA